MANLPTFLRFVSFRWHACELSCLEYFTALVRTSQLKQPVNRRCAKSPIPINETSEAILMKCGRPIDIHDIITSANFWGLRSRNGGVTGVIFPFPIGLCGRSYNNLALIVRVCG